MTKHAFELYVTGRTIRSELAIRNLLEVCERELSGQYVLNVIDVLDCPHLADRENILATPVLIRRQPEPRRRIVGDLSNQEEILASLFLEPMDAAPATLESEQHTEEIP